MKLFELLQDTFFLNFLPRNFRTITDAKPNNVNKMLEEFSQLSGDLALTKLNSNESGISKTDAQKRLIKYGHNVIAQEKKVNPVVLFLMHLKNPLTIMLIVLASISLYLNDISAALVIGGMTMISVILSFTQELRSSKAAEKLSKMVSSTASVRRLDRDYIPQKDLAPFGIKIHKPQAQTVEVPIREIVPGDIVHLSAGDLVPADIRLLSAKDLFVNQAVLTGEAMPVEKFASNEFSASGGTFDLPNICFMGSNIESGTAVGVVVLTGKNTYLGSIADTLQSAPVPTSFDIGVKKFTWLMLSFMLVMVPFVMLINGFLKHNWMEAFLFGLSVAVGLAPEMLPMIVTVNLAKGTIALSRQKVIVKRLNSIQNFGAMDVLCTDKTGTLTQDKIILKRHMDVSGEESEHVLQLAYLNSYYQTGLKNLLDVAVLEHAELKEHMVANKYAEKIDEIPFDFIRKRMSVIVEHKDDESHLLITKGAVEETLKQCIFAEVGDKVVPIDNKMHAEVLQTVHDLNEEGFRVIAVAYKHLPDGQDTYLVADESELTLAGYIAFLDPPKETAVEAISTLSAHGVEVKILTGDNEIVTKKVCKDVGLKIKGIYKGSQIDTMSDDELKVVVEEANIFAKLSPDNKARIVKTLRANGHTVGFMGDGINDAPAMKNADVGISVDSAVDIAKETADIILLEKSLLVLENGVVGGRKVFGNIIKYIKMGASSNFGNMFSVLGASAFLPFLPMLPIQILTNNFLYDISQSSTPTDNVDDEFIAKPQKWDISEIRDFMIAIGPLSSIFDYATYIVMLYVFGCWTNPAMFQTGWFVESLISQTLIVHIIRTNKIPFIQSVASLPVILLTSLVMAFGLWLPFSPFAAALGFVELPLKYFVILTAMMFAYAVIVQVVKTKYVNWLANKKLLKASI